MNSSFTNSLPKLHVLSQKGSLGLPILFVPGMFGIAEHYKSDMDALHEYTVYAMSVRGRGQSEAPEDGYTFEDHVDDVVRVIDQIQEAEIVLCGHSYGCLLVVAAAAERRDRIASVVLIDRGLEARRISEAWLENLRENPPEGSSVEVAEQIILASREVNLWQTYQDLKKPVTVIKGDQSDSHINENDLVRFEAHPQAQIVHLPHSGHTPTKDDYPLFLETLKRLLDA